MHFQNEPQSTPNVPQIQLFSTNCDMPSSSKAMNLEVNGDDHLQHYYK